MVKEKRGSLILMGAALSLLAVVFSVWLVNRRQPVPVPPSRPVPVSAIRPERGDLSELLILPAVLEAHQTVAVVPRVAGLLLEVPAEEGVSVREGDLLARVDAEPYLLELRSAESAWKLGESSLSRIQAVHASSGTSRQQLDETIAARDAALAAYQLAKLRFEYTEVRSPVNGRILQRFFDAGNAAPTDRPLLLIGDDSTLLMKVRVPEKYWSGFSGSEPAAVKASFPGNGGADERNIRILRVAPAISPEDRTFNVTCVMDRDSADWPLGARVEVTFTLREQRDAWSLPLRALSGDGFLWRVNPGDGTVSRLKAPDIFRDSERFAVPAEWSDSLFVLDGQNRVSEGRTVAAVEAGA